MGNYYTFKEKSNNYIVHKKIFIKYRKNKKRSNKILLLRVYEDFLLILKKNKKNIINQIKIKLFFKEIEEFYDRI